MSVHEGFVINQSWFMLHVKEFNSFLNYLPEKDASYEIVKQRNLCLIMKIRLNGK